MARWFLRAAMCLLSLSGCGGSDGNGGSGTIIVPPPSGSIPTPTPTTPATQPLPVALSCNAMDAVTRLDAARIVPVDGKVLVVAVGSSSTFGAFASSPAATYPAVMQQLLSLRSEPPTYEVLNLGVNGDTLAGVENRLSRDVLDRKPQFVVLQVGVNDSRIDWNGAEVGVFSARLRSVVSRIKAVSPTALMNGQHYPSEPASYVTYQNAVAQVAQEQNVPMIDRYGVMRSQISSGRYRYSDVLASDAFHPNDNTYRCMAEIGADLVVRQTARAD